MGLLRIIHPELKFDRSKSQAKKNQIRLYSLIKELFPFVEVNWESRLQLENNTNARRPIELDIFIPSLSLGFEYQGIQHFRDTSRISISNAQKLRDTNKRKLCTLAGITLIEIPYWWSASTTNLAIEIRKVRSDLLKDFKIEEMKAPGILDICDFTETVQLPPSDLMNATMWDSTSPNALDSSNKSEVT